MEAAKTHISQFPEYYAKVIYREIAAIEHAQKKARMYSQFTWKAYLNNFENELHKTLDQIKFGGW